MLDRLAWLAILATFSLAPAASSQTLTLETILSAPFPSDLVGDPDRGRLAWVQNAEGRRNVWFASAPDAPGRQITRYQEDDGQDLGQLAFVPGSDLLVFVRGGAPNRDDDRNVPFSESVDLAEALARAGVDYEQLVFPDEVHDFLVHEHWLEAYHASADFFDRRLGRRSERTSP